MKLIKIKWNIILRGLILLLLTGICIPSFLAVSEAVFRTDDFANYNGVLTQTKGISYLEKCFYETMKLYKTWQGTYVSCFLLEVCNPLRIYSYDMLRAILGIILFMAIAGLFFGIKEAVDYFNVGKNNILYIMALIIFPFMAYREYQEVYLWYTGAMVYLLPMVFFLWGIVFVLRGRTKGKKSYYVLASFCVFLMTGGVLEVVGVGVFALLWFTVVDYFKSKKINRSFAGIFVIALTGASVNAFAPGNFVRHSIFDEKKISVLRCLFFSVKAALEEMEILLRTTTFFVFVILAFILGVNINKKITNKLFVVLLSGLLIMPIVTAFPVVMGYSSPGIVRFGNRCRFVIDAVIYGSVVASAILTGNYMRYRLPNRRIVYFISGVAIAISVIRGGGWIASNYPKEIVRGYKEGVIQNYSETWINIYDEIRYHDEANVVIIGKKPESCPGCSHIDLSEEPEDWHNACVAAYFGKESVCFIQEE